MNEVFDPNRVDHFYDQAVAIRQESIAADKGTNYGVVRLELLEHLYGDLYLQRIREPDEEKWQHRILSNRSIVDVEDAGNLVNVTVEKPSSDPSSAKKVKETLSFDAVLVATGYQRDAHDDILRHSKHLTPDGQWNVSRHYGVKLDAEKVSHDAGIWLQGCNENTHGLSDTLLSILAVRGGEIVQSILGDKL